MYLLGIIDQIDYHSMTLQNEILLIIIIGGSMIFNLFFFHSMTFFVVTRK